MHSYSVWDVLADASSLTPAQKRAMAQIFVEQAPHSAARFFARPDLDDETRDQMVNSTRNPSVLAAFLATPAVAISHMLSAATVLGAETVLLGATRSGWNSTEELLPLLEELDHEAACRVARAGRDIPPQLRSALIRAAARPPAALRDRPERLSEREREKLLAAVSAWHDDVWDLLDAAPARPLWSELVRDDHAGRLITSLLLNRADGLDDWVLRSCLESAFPKDPTQDEGQATRISGVLGASITFGRLADIHERHPRALLLHGPTIRNVIAGSTGEMTQEIREDGIDESSWNVFEAFAAVCTSPELLADAALCLSQATPPAWQARQPATREWIAARSRAADAMVRNPFFQAEALAPLISFLGAATAAHFVEHPDGRVRKAAALVVDQATEQGQSAQPVHERPDQPASVGVPGDAVLAQQDDPVAALSSFLPLKGSAARRRETAAAILDSRYAAPTHLQLLPAALVLAHTAHASAVAAVLLEELGESSESWNRFHSSVLRLTPSSTKMLGTLIREATVPTP
ncbi:hypothetical protein AB0O51_26930 [Streptomyces sp. NPDC090301]|uniref:hypothetical protein n=1 Tax=Streptomyces sp. NPDC090301 TaxID=3154975 RepID=UPI0034484ED9